MRFSTYISIDGRTNGILVKVKASLSRYILNLDCAGGDFFKKPYFSRKVRISVRDWMFFSIVFVFQHVSQKTTSFSTTINFGENLSLRSLENVSLQNIQSAVCRYLMPVLILFKKSSGIYRKCIHKCELTQRGDLSNVGVHSITIGQLRMTFYYNYYKGTDCMLHHFQRLARMSKQIVL